MKGLKNILYTTLIALTPFLFGCEKETVEIIEACDEYLSSVLHGTKPVKRKRFLKEDDKNTSLSKILNEVKKMSNNEKKVLIGELVKLI